MPNINLLTAINTASSSTYVVLSDNGFARRMSFAYLTHAVEAGFAGPARTNQYLYTTSSVEFGVVSLVGNTTSTSAANNHITPFGFSSTPSHADGTSIKLGDIVGTVRFGGFDGHQLRTGLFNLGASANENFAVNENNVTTNAGVNWSIGCQPAGIQLTDNSIMKMIAGGTRAGSGTPTSPPTMILNIGSGVDGLTPALTSSAGTSFYTGHGRTDLNFFHSRVTQIGVTGGPADNPTITATNIYTFLTSRKNAADISNRRHLATNDIIGAIKFSGVVEDGSSIPPPPAAEIRVSTLEEFSTSTNGGSMVFLTAPQSTSTIALTTSGPVVVTVSTSTLERRLFLSDRANTHYSKQHTLLDNGGNLMFRASTTTVSLLGGQFEFHKNGGITFPDGSSQNTAFEVVALPPTSSSAPGVVGQIAYDAGYVYICVGLNTWRRMPASTF